MPQIQVCAGGRRGLQTGPRDAIIAVNPGCIPGKGDEMTRIGIISAMPVELENFTGALHAEPLGDRRFYKLDRGEIGKTEVYLACCGIGKVNAAVCTQKLIDLYGVEAIINMGIAGGVAPQLRTLDLVIGSEVLYHDFTPPELLKKYYPFSQAFPCDKKLVALAEQACRNCPETDRYYVGRVASGDCFVEDDAVKARIRDTLGGLCCEMEGAAIGHAAFVSGVPFVIIRSISDLADGNAQLSYDEFEKKAALQANRIVLGILRQLG